MVRHPAAVPFMSKEAHFFDRDETFSKGIRHYMSSALDPVKLHHARSSGALGGGSLVDLHGAATPPDALQAAGMTATYDEFARSEALRAELGKTFTLETTPAYILDSRAAVKMATLLPHAKLLLILRDPVDRAYSEWNMKLRRVQGQFHASDTAHLQRVYHGLIKPCFNHPKRQHEYNATATAPRSTEQQREMQGGQLARHSGSDVFRCLLQHLPKDEAVKRLLRPSAVLRGTVAPCLVKGTARPWAKRRVPQGLPDYRNQPARGVPVPKDAGTQYARRLAALSAALPAAVRAAGAGARPSTERRTQDTQGQGIVTRFVQQLAAGAQWAARGLGAAALAAERGVEGGLRATSPWSAPPGTHAAADMDADAQELRRVLARLPETTSLPPLDLAKRCLSPPLVRPERVPPVSSLEAEADAITAHCVRSDGSVRWGEVGCWANGLTSNIVNEYVARGLYLPQLRLFHEVFGKDKIMVLSDTELLDEKARPETLKRVFAFLGLPPLEAPALAELADGDATQVVFKRLFPDFERTGWQAKSSYAPLPRGIRARLEKLFKPLNAQLYEYLGRDLGWGKGDE